MRCFKRPDPKYKYATPCVRRYKGFLWVQFYTFTELKMTVCRKWHFSILQARKHLLRMSLVACVTPDTTHFISSVEFPLNHFQKPHKRKQGDHIGCRGSPGIPLLLFLLSRSHVTHCFDWQDFQRWAQGLQEPSSFFHACLCVSPCFSLPPLPFHSVHTLSMCCTLAFIKCTTTSLSFSSPPSF